jgi:hypothetical protein
VWSHHPPPASSARSAYVGDPALPADSDEVLSRGLGLRPGAHWSTRTDQAINDQALTDQPHWFRHVGDPALLGQLASAVACGAFSLCGSANVRCRAFAALISGALALILESELQCHGLGGSRARLMAPVTVS